jgi:hypothetical protein
MVLNERIILIAEGKATWSQNHETQPRAMV